MPLACVAMSRRRLVWPPGIRWLAVGIAAVVLALAVAWVLFVPGADWLARHDVGSARGVLLQTARDDARGRLLTLGAGLLAASALLFTARNFTLSRRTLELTEQGQVTDRYTKAIEQLGSEKLDVRVGGIYALERIARDSARDHPTVMEVLTTFIREHSRDPRPGPNPGGQEQERPIRPDVQAALTVIARRNANCDVQRIDLSGIDLSGARLSGANLSGIELSRACLSDADLIRADLRGAALFHTILTRAILINTILIKAHLLYADLRGAALYNADLTGADLTGARLSGADLTGVVHTVLDNGAVIVGAHLGFANLTRADLTDVWWPRDAEIPGGWKRNPYSGRLSRGD